MSATNYTLFADVAGFYQNMIAALRQAGQRIDMIYFAFDHGKWSGQISRVLQQKVANGVPVRLMVDELGMVVDNIKNAWRNQALLAELRAAGVQVDVFRPAGRRLSQFNRLHVKLCAIDEQVTFVGGSNIGDHYPRWRDSNLRLDGELGNTFTELYSYLCHFSCSYADRETPRRVNLRLNDASLLLTLPGHRQDIRRALLNLILDAEQAITIRTWYFLPDREILNALLSQAENGVNVTILFSHRTRVPFIDALNTLIASKLAKAGVRVYRYKGRFMHAKEAWNDNGDILFGSANVDLWALYSNFECNLQFNNPHLARQLQHSLAADLVCCQQRHPHPAWLQALPHPILPHRINF